ncbi:MAG: ATP-binding protein [Bacteroides sp.]|nr:ATP-binding protein [Bacteroides sp.]
MIVEFKIKNFRSYKEETTFTFEALNEDFKNENYTIVELENEERIKLLKSAAIFGANASGKSNIIWAFQALSFLVAQSRNFDARTLIPVYTPFMMDETTRNSPTEFTIDFIIQKIRYRYTIHFDYIIRLEKLDIIEKGKEICVFKMDGETNPEKRPLTFEEGYKSETLDMSNMQMLPNQLVLSGIGIKPDNGLLEVYKALADIQAEPVGDSINLKTNNENVAANILKNSDSKLFHQLKRLIHVADMGIDDIIMKEHGESEFKFPNSVPDNIKKAVIQENKWEFGMRHGNVILGMMYESTGTKNLFGLGARILNILDKGGILVYDEMNIAIHPALFHLLVSLFHSPISNPHHAQLLFTTHDASIAGDSMLRADQIWFAEKEKDGASQLYSAQDFEDISINLPFENWYRSGRFGALPQFGNINYIFNDEKQ